MGWNRNGRARVRVFVDYSNFKENWKRVTQLHPDANLMWDEFPSVILDRLDRMDHLSGMAKEMRAIKVYASVKPFDESVPPPLADAEDERERLFKRWLQDDLDQLPGYTVDISTRVNVPVSCDACSETTDHYVEQGVDTKIAIDLLALATSDLYDIGVLVTDDADLIPSTQCVQDVLDKHIVHLGFSNGKKESALRACSWGHLLLDDMLPMLVRTKSKTILANS